MPSSISTPLPQPLGTGDSPTFAKTFMDGGNNSILRVGQLDGGGNFYLLSDLTAAGTSRGLVLGTGVNKPVTFDVNGISVWQMTTTGLVGSGSFLQLGDASTPSSPTSAANILSSGGILSGQNSGESAALPIPRYLSGSGSFSGTVSANSQASQIFTLTGAKVGFPVVPSYSADLVSLLNANPNVVVFVYCAANDTVTLQFLNNSLTNTITATGNYAFTIFQ